MRRTEFAAAVAQVRWAGLIAGLCATLLALAHGAATAGDHARRAGDARPWIEFHFDNPPRGTLHPTGDLTFGGSIEALAEAELGFDLDRAEGADKIHIAPILTFRADYTPGAYLHAFAELQLERKLVIQDPKHRAGRLTVRVQEAGATFRDLAGDLTVTLGRWDVSDRREWLLDENLDGIEVVWRGGRFALEAAILREDSTGADLTRRRPGDKRNLVYLRGHAALGERSLGDAWLLFVDGRRRDGNGNLTFVGASTYGKLGGGFDYWAEAAFVAGREKGRAVRGYGVDLGLTRRYRDLPLQPHGTLAVAFGSGDDGRGVDTAFRQTGLQGNDSKFGGVTRFAHYGEVLDPELSNLLVLTLGAGFRPTRRSSVDIVYHRYLQHRRADRLRDVEIDPDPTGRRRHIGDAFDLVIGVREWEFLDLEVVGGVFLPGGAFGPGADPAYFLSGSVEIKF